MDGVRTAEGGEGVTSAMLRARIRVDGRLEGGLQALLGAPMAAYSGCGEGDGGIGRSKRHSRTGVARVCVDVGSVADGSSSWKWNRSQPGQGAAELLLPRPAPGKMQGQPAGRAGEPPGQGEEPPPEGLGGHDLLAQAEPRRPAGQVVRHHLDRQPGGEAARGEMVQPDAVLEVAYRILDLGVAAVVGLQFQGLSVPVGDEAVIAVGGEESQLGTGRRLHPPDDEPHRCGVGLTLEGGAGGFGHIGGAVHPVGNRRPGIFGYRLDQVPQALVLADGDGAADIHPAADGDHGVGIEAAVGPHRELPPGPGVAHPPHRLTQEVGGAAGGIGAALPEPGQQHVAGAGGQQRVIAPGAGVAVVAGALLG